MAAVTSPALGCGHHHAHAHKHITRAVVAMDSCFGLVRPDQLGTANAETGLILSGVDDILAGNTYNS